VSSRLEYRVKQTPFVATRMSNSKSGFMHKSTCGVFPLAFSYVTQYWIRKRYISNPNTKSLTFVYVDMVRYIQVEVHS
jgi:hypothetical protein